MTAESPGEQQQPDPSSRPCPLERVCVEGQCPGVQRALGYSGTEGTVDMGGIIVNVDYARRVEWCGQEGAPPSVQAYQESRPYNRLDDF